MLASSLLRDWLLIGMLMLKLDVNPVAETEKQIKTISEAIVPSRNNPVLNYIGGLCQQMAFCIKSVTHLGAQGNHLSGFCAEGNMFICIMPFFLKC